MVRLMTTILAPAIDRYLAGLVPEPDAVLAEMNAHGERDGIPIVDPETGTLLAVLARAVGARRVVEVGTAIGVSTLHLARAVGDGGLVTSFEIDPARHSAAREYLTRAGMIDRTDLRLQDAAAGLRELEGSVDMAFLDGLKTDYPSTWSSCSRTCAPAASWRSTTSSCRARSRQAVERATGPMSMSARMREFNHRLTTDPRLEATVLPVGDGVAVAVRR